jgi:putative ABC transport system ATP-binding protein
VVVDGHDLSTAKPRDLTRYCRDRVGFVFQFYNLVPTLTAVENVELATQLAPDPQSPAQALADVGLAGKLDSFPAQLSGGEQQRVAIARALAKRPALLLCDEPTGALDQASGLEVLELIQNMNRRHGVTVVIITHNPVICAIADLVIEVRDGTVRNLTHNPSPVDAATLVL